MKIVLLQILLFLIATPLLAQKNKAEIKGTLDTGETLTVEYPSGDFVYSVEYTWYTSSDANGVADLKKVGSDRNYKLADADAGRYVNVQIVVSRLFGSKKTYISDWYGPVHNNVPLLIGAVTISGNLKSGNEVNVNYVYSPDNYPESGTTFRWYLADNTSGANAAQIGNLSSLPATDDMVAKYLRVEVIPRDQRGISGKSYTSSWTGPIEKPAPPANKPPVATNVRITGNPVVCGTLTGQYNYFDQEQDPESGSTFRWMRASSENDNPTAISGATSRTYVITADDQGFYLYFEVTPRATTGDVGGSPVLSNPVGLIQNNLPTVTFEGDASICEGSSTNLSLSFTGTPPFKLDYTNGNSNFSLNTGSYSYQLKVTEGGTYKGLKLTDKLSCPVTNLASSAVVAVKPKPDLGFFVENTCYTGQPTQFKNTSSTKNNISWRWNFGEVSGGADQSVSTEESPMHKYATKGTYPVQLVGINTDGCSDTVVRSIKLGEKPQVNFTWDRECLDPNKPTRFQEASGGGEVISQYKWSLMKGNATLNESSSGAFSYNIPEAGSYNVTLKVVTDLGCKDSLSKTLLVQPVFHLKDSFYFNGFDKNNSDWHTSQVRDNQWQIGIPSGSGGIQAHSLPNAAYTAFGGKRQNQQLEITSACFDFTGMQKPFIEFWINYNSQESKEGAVLQYITEGETNWKNVGDVNSGEKWYNSNAIGSRPGNQSVGWTGNSNGWVHARQSLTEVANKSNVRLRMVYGSSADATGRGFAFDDVFIGQRDKKVLFEYFSNLTDLFSTKTNQVYDSLLYLAGTGAVGIQYHTSFPGPDSLNAVNSSNPAARVLYYGIGSVPAALMDGAPDQHYVYDFVLNNPSINDITRRSLEDPLFGLMLAGNYVDGVISGTVKITALKTITGLSATLNLAFVEDINARQGNKPVVLRNVLRYLYPSSGGTPMEPSWYKDQQRDVLFSWPVKNVADLKKLKLVAFVQDNSSKEIYQVETGLTNTVTGINPDIGEDTLNITLYPNPASKYVYLSFGTELTGNVNLTIYNTQGKVCKEGIITKGVSLYYIDTENLPSGIFLLKLTGEKGVSKSLKLVINNSL